MSKVKKQPSFKAYAAMWIAIIAAYAVWMIAFMRKIVLVNYATVEERTVDGITHANISGMMGHEWLYPIWVAVSCICLAMFIVYIKVLLYGKEPGKALKIFCLFGVIFGCVYVTWYGFFGDQPFIEKVKFITASMIGLDFPWHFRGWGVIASATVFTNTLYAYRKFGYHSRAGVIHSRLDRQRRNLCYYKLPVDGRGDASCFSALHGALDGRAPVRVLLRRSHGAPAYK